MPPDANAIAQNRPRRLAWLCAAALLACGCTTLAPSNARNWEPDQAVLASAHFRGDEVEVRNVRNCIHLSEDEYALDYYDKTFDLNRLDSVDFIKVPLKGMPGLAHTMLSFGFQGEEYLAVSVEVRKERGETYRPLLGVLNQYEIMYVVGDERDLVKLRTNFRQDDVYVYRVRATPEQVRALFVDVVERVNKLHGEPEFYHTITNNCTTNIVHHINRIAPELVAYDYRVLLPGFSDELAYELGLLDTESSFEETKFQAQRSHIARRHAHSRDFSQQIRR